MNHNWKRNAAAIIVSAALLVTAQPYHAAAGSGGASYTLAEEASYALTDVLEAGVKSVVYDRSGDGSSIGAVIRLTNQGKRITRIPDYELRIQAEDGTQYMLSGSTANAKAIQPKETVELVYMARVDTAEPIVLSHLTWVETDEYVYPKLETEKLSVPVAGRVWQSGGPAEEGGVAVKPWGEAFSIPQMAGTLVFRGFHSTKEYTEDGMMTVVTLAVENRGDLKQSVPDFRLDGRGEGRLYRGSRIGGGTPPVLEPGETGYVHFAMDTPSENGLLGYLLQTEEVFFGSNGKVTPYSTGWLEIAPPDAEDAQAYMEGLPPYRLHTPIPFEPSNRLIPKDTDVSLERLQVLESGPDGFLAVSARFKLTNRQSYPVPFPNFQTDVLTGDGGRYTGSKTANGTPMLLPRFSHMAEYVFVLPPEALDGKLALRLSDSRTLAPYTLPIAEFRTELQEEKPDHAVSVYPFEVKFKDWTVQTASQLSGAKTVYSQEVGISWETPRTDKVLYDGAKEKIRIELARNDGTKLGSHTVPLMPEAGANTARHTLLFKDTGYTGGSLMLRIYETVSTPFGTVERLLTTLKE